MQLVLNLSLLILIQLTSNRVLSSDQSSTTTTATTSLSTTTNVLTTTLKPPTTTLVSATIKPNSKLVYSENDEVLKGQEQNQRPSLRERGNNINNNLQSPYGAAGPYGLPFSAFLPQRLPFSTPPTDFLTRGSPALIGSGQGLNNNNNNNNNYRGPLAGPLQLLSGFIPGAGSGASGLPSTGGPYGGAPGLGYPGQGFVPGLNGYGQNGGLLGQNNNNNLNNNNNNLGYGGVNPVRGGGAGGGGTRYGVGGNGLNNLSPTNDGSGNEVDSDQNSDGDDAGSAGDESGNDEEASDADGDAQGEPGSAGSEDNNQENNQENQDPSKDPDLAQFGNLQGGNFPADLFPPGLLSQQDLNDIQKSMDEQAKKEAEKRRQEEEAANQDQDDQSGGEGNNGGGEEVNNHVGGGGGGNVAGEEERPRGGLVNNNNNNYNYNNINNIPKTGSYPNLPSSVGVNYNQGNLPQPFNPVDSSYLGNGRQLNLNQNRNNYNSMDVYPRQHNQLVGNSGLKSNLGSNRYDGSLNSRPWDNYGSIGGVNQRRPSFNPASVEYDRGSNKIPDYLNQYRRPSSGGLERSRFRAHDDEDEDDEEEENDHRRPMGRYGNSFSAHKRRPDFGGHSLNSNRRQSEIEAGVLYEGDDVGGGKSSGGDSSGSLMSNNQRNQRKRIQNLRPLVEYDRSTAGLTSNGFRPRFSGGSTNVQPSIGAYRDGTKQSTQNYPQLKANSPSNNKIIPSKVYYKRDPNLMSNSNSDSKNDRPNNRFTSSYVINDDENDSNDNLPAYRQTPRFVASQRKTIPYTINDQNANPFLRN